MSLWQACAEAAAVAAAARATADADADAGGRAPRRPPLAARNAADGSPGASPAKHARDGEAEAEEAPPPPPARARVDRASFYSAAPSDASLARLLAAVDARLARGRGGAPPGAVVFRRQAPAFAAADAAPASAAARVFSEEVSASGARVYVVASLPAFWRRYRGTASEQRHAYEILREGRPCHAYLDIEFKPEHNPGVDGDALVAGVVEALVGEVAARWPDIAPRPSPADVLELDASSPAKFSRHVTLRMAGAAFASVADAGAVARAAVERAGAAARAGAPHPPPDIATSADAGAPPGCAVDMGVYTRNRAWRMAGSSKVGAPGRVLRPTRRWAGAAASDRAAFFCALAGDVSPGARLLEVDGAYYGGGGGAPAAGRARGARAPPRAPTLAALPGPSPLPAVDAFIESVAADASRDPGAAVRTWALSRSTLVLALRGGRHCARVGRAHKSNGVYYVIDLVAGAYQQRCHDPECAGFRSEARPLPADVARVAAAAATAADPAPIDPYDDATLLTAVDAAEAAALAARADDAALVAAADAAVAAELLKRRREGG